MSDDIKAMLTAELGKISSQVKEAGEKALAEAAKGIAASAEQKARIDELLLKSGELQARLGEVEQKAVRRGEEQKAEESVGERFVGSDQWKSYVERGFSGRVKVPFASVTSIGSATSGAGAAGDLVRSDRVQGIVTPPERRMTVRDLITPGRTSSNLIEYVKETGFQNMADIQTEGATKPQSDLVFDLATSPVVTIAHWVLASKQILDDAAMLQSYIDGRLRYGLKYVEEAQLLKGSGVGLNLNGIYTQATAYSAPISVTAETRIDRLRLMMLQAELAEFPATGIVLHPADWAAIELTKEATTNAYLWANPRASAGPMLWGLPVVATQAMTIDTALVGAFRLGAQLFDREDANVQVSTEDSDNFRKNMVTIRAEERLALAVYRPEAFIKATDISP
jgi:HK97 family phage major capsid protein